MIAPKNAESVDIELLSFKRELEKLLNIHSIDNYTGIPDFILSNYMCNHLRELVLLNEAAGQHKFSEHAHPL